MTLTGKIQVVENSPLIAASSNDMLRTLGCTVVRPAQNMAAATELCHSANIDAARADLNIRGGKAFPLLRV